MTRNPHLEPSRQPAAASRRTLLGWAAALGAGLAIGSPVLSACSSRTPAGSDRQASPPARPTGVLKVAQNAAPGSLNPTLATGFTELGFLASMYEPLVRFKGDSVELEGVLAESFESSPDAREWTFRIREGITFHDGEPLTSTAVKASFERYAATPGLWQTWVPAKATYDDSDSKVLRIVTEDPFPDLARNAAALYVVSPKLLAAGEDAVAKSPSGTGPFRFVSADPSEKIVLEANPAYRGPGPFVERIEMPVIPDPSARAAALRSGAVDVVRQMTPEDAAPLAKSDAFVVSKKAVGLTTHLWLNLDAEPTGNVKVRQAMSYAIDRRALIKAIWSGDARISDSVIPPSSYGHRAVERYSPQNLDRARQLIADSGLSTPVRMKAVWIAERGATRRDDRVLPAISAMLKEVGIEMTVRSIPLSEAGKPFADLDAAKPWEAVIFPVENGLNAGQVGFSSKVFDYICGTDEDARFQDLQRKLQTTPDGPERVKAAADIQEYVAEQQPTIQLFEPLVIDAHKRTVHGYQTPRDGMQSDFSTAYLS